MWEKQNVMLAVRISVAVMMFVADRLVVVVGSLTHELDIFATL